MTELDSTEDKRPDVTRTSGSGSAALKSEADFRPGAEVQAQQDPDAITLADYARRHGLDEQEVWRMLRRGEIIGRTIRGRLFIYVNPEAAAQALTLVDLDIDPARDGAEPDSSDMPQVAVQTNELADEARPVNDAPAIETQAATDDDLQDLPPLPHDPAFRVGATAQMQAPSGGLANLDDQRQISPEVALLLDHLSLAKEENREILRMAQESIRKVTELNDQILEMKDAVIEAKQAQLQAVEDRIDQLESKLSKVSQEKEDLEILAQTIAEAKNLRT